MNTNSQPMTVAGLFAGIGGIELGLEWAGLETAMLCEWSPEAQAVLRRQIPDAAFENDIRDLVDRPRYRLPKVDVVTAGFPCQDLSQCGRTAGIGGKQSGLVGSLLELLDRRLRSPRWLVVENVPFMLQLDRGRAMHRLTRSLEMLGFTWAYRVVDARSFGLPQRRQRVILVASRTEDPRSVLFADRIAPRPVEDDRGDRPRGFYWTEGNRGLGWAVDAVPTLKAGSTIGIPSPPAIWLPAFDEFVTPTIEDAEAMQGFPRGWTSLAHVRPSMSVRNRWRLVGNAVPPPIARWLGERLQEPGEIDADGFRRLQRSGSWPIAAWGQKGERWAVDTTSWPVSRPWSGLSVRFGDRGERLSARPKLSLRASKGFLHRIKRSTLRTDPRFIPSLERYVEKIQSP